MLRNNNMILSEKSVKIQKMFDKISNRYDFLNRLLSFKQDVIWRNELIKQISTIKNRNGTICDVACGTGDVVFLAKERRPDFVNFIGVDFSEGMLSQAKLRNKNVQNSINFIQASAEDIPLSENSVDCVTIAFGFRNVDSREKALLEFYRILKSGGELFILEFFKPKNNLLAKFFDFYFKKILPFIGGLFSDKEAYKYLPDSVSSMPNETVFLSMLEKNGFHQIQQKTWFSGTTRLFKATKK